MVRWGTAGPTPAPDPGAPAAHAFRGLPDGLDLSGLKTPGELPWQYDVTVPSPDGARFATAYEVCEVTMGNYMGKLVGGTLRDGKAVLTGNLLPGPAILVWQDPFCHWIANDIFVVKFDGGDRWPLLAIRADGRFQPVGSDALGSQPRDVSIFDIDPEAWVADPPPPPGATKLGLPRAALAPFPSQSGRVFATSGQ